MGDSQVSAGQEVWIVEIQTTHTIHVTACKVKFPALSSREQSFAIRISSMVWVLLLYGELHGMFQFSLLLYFSGDNRTVQ